MTADTIAILDDELERLDAMVPILSKRYSTLNVVTLTMLQTSTLGLLIICSHAFSSALTTILAQIANVMVLYSTLGSDAM